MSQETDNIRPESDDCPPHVVFYNLTNSGASAVVPIIEELLVNEQGYTSLGDPSNSHEFASFFSGERIVFHWTHSPPSTFRSFLERDDFRFICLYRDPRDVMVSHIKDVIHRDLNEGKTETDLYHEYIGSNFDGMYHYADEWLHLDQPNVISFSFEELKKNVEGTIRNLFKFLQLEVNEESLRSCCEKYSFESVTQRSPGIEGPIVRNNLMYRKGISGDWKNQFDDSVSKAFDDRFQIFLNRWGYGSNPSMKEFQLVSPPLPCGVGWLVNVLLELGIKTSHNHESYLRDHWQQDEFGQACIHPKAKEHLQWHLPVLRSEQSFKFQPNIEVRWEHRLDFARNPQPTILFTRDGRDAVYSHYRRHHKHQSSFDDFLIQPDKWPDHFPEMFDLPPAETWALFNYFWLEMSHVMPVIVVRFEDTKANPIREIQRVLKFLETHRSDAEIVAAVEKSTFIKAQKQELETAVESDTSSRNNHRKGMPFEWKSHFQPDQLIRFSGLPDEILHRLGYETICPSSPKFTEQSLSIDIDQEIQSCRASSDWSNVKKSLLHEILKTSSNKTRWRLCSELIAHDWTQRIFKMDLYQSLAANHIRQSISKLLARHAKSNIIQNLFSRNIQFDPVISPMGLHRGYVLVQVDRSFFALSPALGPDFDILKQSQESIIQLAQQGLCIVVATESRLTKSVDLLIDSILANAKKLASSGHAYAASEIFQRCIVLTGGKDSKSIKAANFAQKLATT